MDYATLDIETGKKGNVLQIRIYNDKFGFNSFDTWDDFYTFLSKNNDKPCYRQFIAHNGGRFDYVSMLYALLPKTWSTSIIMSGSGIIICSINDFKKRVTFKDSIKVMTGSLKGLCKTFKVETPKSDIDIDRIEEIFNNDRPQFDYYLDNDCVSLFQVCKEFQKKLDIKYFPITIASLAMKIYYEKFKPDYQFVDTSSLNEVDTKILDESYAGGRVEVFRKGEHDNVNTYDVNSLYPYVMKENFFPVYPVIRGKKYEPGDMGIYECSFIQNNKSIPPCLWIKGENGLEFTYEGQGSYTSVEIEQAVKYGLDIKIGYGLYFPKKHKIFTKYVDYFYNLRMSNKNNALNLISKLLLNSLYGKFAERTEGTMLSQLSDDDKKKFTAKGIGFSEYSENMNLYLVETKRRIKHPHKYISIFTTAYARCYMYDFLVKYAKNVVYMDTDSIHMTDKMDNEFIGSKIGLFKPEYSGKGIYNGRKQYIIDKTLRFKGMRTQGNLFHEKITYEDFKAMLEGEVIKKEYDTFPALKTVIKKGEPCKLTRTQKNIKSSDFTSNMEV
jgi:hypothetical protein